MSRYTSTQYCLPPYTTPINLSEAALPITIPSTLLLQSVNALLWDHPVPRNNVTVPTHHHDHIHNSTCDDQPPPKLLDALQANHLPTSSQTIQSTLHPTPSLLPVAAPTTGVSTLALPNQQEDLVDPLRMFSYLTINPEHLLSIFPITEFTCSKWRNVLQERIQNFNHLKTFCLTEEYTDNNPKYTFTCQMSMRWGNRVVYGIGVSKSKKKDSMQFASFLLLLHVTLEYLFEICKKHGVNPHTFSQPPVLQLQTTDAFAPHSVSPQSLVLNNNNNPSTFSPISCLHNPITSSSAKFPLTITTLPRHFTAVQSAPHQPLMFSPPHPDVVRINLIYQLFGSLFTPLQRQLSLFNTIARMQYKCTPLSSLQNATSLLLRTICRKNDVILATYPISPYLFEVIELLELKVYLIPMNIISPDKTNNATTTLEIPSGDSDADAQYGNAPFHAGPRKGFKFIYHKTANTFPSNDISTNLHIHQTSTFTPTTTSTVTPLTPTIMDQNNLSNIQSDVNSDPTMTNPLIASTIKSEQFTNETAVPTLQHTPSRQTTKVEPISPIPQQLISTTLNSPMATTPPYTNQSLPINTTQNGDNDLSEHTPHKIPNYIHFQYVPTIDLLQFKIMLHILQPTAVVLNNILMEQHIQESLIKALITHNTKIQKDKPSLSPAHARKAIFNPADNFRRDNSGSGHNNDDDGDNTNNNNNLTDIDDDIDDLAETTSYSQFLSSSSNRTTIMTTTTIPTSTPNTTSPADLSSSPLTYLICDTTYHSVFCNYDYYLPQSISKVEHPLVTFARVTKQFSPFQSHSYSKNNYKHGRATHHHRRNSQTSNLPTRKTSMASTSSAFSVPLPPLHSTIPQSQYQQLLSSPTPDQSDHHHVLKQPRQPLPPIPPANSPPPLPQDPPTCPPTTHHPRTHSSHLNNGLVTDWIACYGTTRLMMGGNDNGYLWLPHHLHETLHKQTKQKTDLLLLAAPPAPFSSSLLIKVMDYIRQPPVDTAIPLHTNSTSVLSAVTHLYPGNISDITIPHSFNRKSKMNLANHPTLRGLLEHVSKVGSVLTENDHLDKIDQFYQYIYQHAQQQAHFRSLAHTTTQFTHHNLYHHHHSHHQPLPPEVSVDKNNMTNTGNTPDDSCVTTNNDDIDGMAADSSHGDDAGGNGGDNGDKPTQHYCTDDSLTSLTNKTTTITANTNNDVESTTISLSSGLSPSTTASTIFSGSSSLPSLHTQHNKHDHGYNPYLNQYHHLLNNQVPFLSEFYPSSKFHVTRHFFDLWVTIKHDNHGSFTLGILRQIQRKHHAMMEGMGSAVVSAGAWSPTLSLTPNQRNAFQNYVKLHNLHYDGTRIYRVDSVPQPSSILLPSLHPPVSSSNTPMSNSSPPQTHEHPNIANTDNNKKNTVKFQLSLEDTATIVNRAYSELLETVFINIPHLQFATPNVHFLSLPYLFLQFFNSELGTNFDQSNNGGHTLSSHSVSHEPVGDLCLFCLPMRLNLLSLALDSLNFVHSAFERLREKLSPLLILPDEENEKHHPAAIVERCDALPDVYGSDALSLYTNTHDIAPTTTVGPNRQSLDHKMISNTEKPSIVDPLASYQAQIYEKIKAQWFTPRRVVLNLSEKDGISKSTYQEHTTDEIVLDPGKSLEIPPNPSHRSQNQPDNSSVAPQQRQKTKIGSFVKHKHIMTKKTSPPSTISTSNTSTLPTTLSSDHHHQPPQLQQPRHQKQILQSHYQPHKQKHQTHQPQQEQHHIQILNVCDPQYHGYQPQNTISLSYHSPNVPSYLPPPAMPLPPAPSMKQYQQAPQQCLPQSHLHHPSQNRHLSELNEQSQDNYFDHLSYLTQESHQLQTYQYDASSQSFYSSQPISTNHLPSILDSNIMGSTPLYNQYPQYSINSDKTNYPLTPTSFIPSYQQQHLPQQQTQRSFCPPFPMYTSYPQPQHQSSLVQQQSSSSQ